MERNRLEPGLRVMLALCFLEMMRQELLATSENEGSEMEAKPDDEPGACLTCEEAAAAAREKPAGDSGSAAAVGEAAIRPHRKNRSAH